MCFIRDVEGCGLCVNYEETFAEIQARSQEIQAEKDKDKQNILKKQPTTGPGKDQQYENQAELNRLFEMLDVDQSGTLEKNELVAACKTLPMFKGQDIDKLANMMDFNKDGNIDLNRKFENKFEKVSKWIDFRKCTCQIEFLNLIYKLFL